MTPSAAARREESEARRNRKKSRQPSLVGLRLRDLNALLTARYGEVLPDDDAGRDDARIVCHHLARYADGIPARRITSWIKLRAPWMPDDEIDALIEECTDKPRKWRADRLAWKLRLIESDRQALSITTIGAIDCGKAQRTKLRKQREKERKRQKRAAAGAKPRSDNLAKTQPWRQLGISRRTWYRRGKPIPPL